jgi:uncharacterized protein YgbK (DUF1537 family)
LKSPALDSPDVLAKAATLAALPHVWSADQLPAIRFRLATGIAKLVVLDDDPTGTQTVQNIAVVTDWSVDTLAAELRSDAPGFFILTNSRSLSPEATVALHATLANNLQQAARRTAVAFTVVSRSDSTLRGHYPLETDTLATALGPMAATLIIPYFDAGGRLTLQGVHYVAEGDQLIPAAQTPFAQDATFGYRHSDLRQWVEEKTGGRIAAAQVNVIRLNTIRQGGPDAVASALNALPPGSVCVIDSLTPRDIDVVAQATLLAEGAGKRFLYRCAASFVAARLGLAPLPLLAREDFKPVPASSGGLVVVGSYVPKTTAQLAHLRTEHPHHLVELSVPDLLDPARRPLAIAEAVQRLNRDLRNGFLTVLATSRQLVQGASPAESLQIINQVSSALVETVRGITIRPRFVIAKGGITSSDIATGGLGVRRAMVRGQILPGVPVWSLGPETRFPGIDYVVFPGNVGTESALANAITKLPHPHLPS